MTNFFKTEKDRNDFYIALAVIGFFIWLFGFSGILGKKTNLNPLKTEITKTTEKAFPLEGKTEEKTSEVKQPKLKEVKDNNIVSEALPTVAAGAAVTASQVIKEVKDSDGDGIADDKDECPNAKGSKEFNGCPDTDGDGVIDSKDKCPKLAGKFDGCPDADNDGVTDDIDKCPSKPGTKANKGCPEIKKEVIEKINLAGKQIQFESAKASLKQASFKSLDNIVAELKNHPKVNVSVEGHTDATGNADKNLTLSQQRAETVKQYLINKGLKNNITSKGFGQTAPIADNKTKNGRYLNRRVEVKLAY